jgi:hypothetical protein
MAVNMTEYETEGRGRGWVSKTVLACFLCFLFFLPLYEAPKNIFSVFFVFLGGWLGFSNKGAIRSVEKWGGARWAFLLLAISPFVAGINSPYAELGARFASALNWSLMPLVALVFLLSNFSRDQILWALRVLCVGTVIAVVQAFFDWTGSYPELNSVGHVNQSALYLAFSLVPAGLLALYRQHWADLILVGAALLAVGWYQGPAKSMIGFGASCLVIAGFWVIYCINRSHIKAFVASVVLGAVVVGAAINMPASYFGPYQGFKQEFDTRLGSKSDPYSQRDRLVNSAVEVAGDSLTGFGMGSFGEATQLQNIQSAVEARGGDWASERGNFFSSSHGHNIFANVLVERGWVGVFVIGIFLLAMLLVSFKHPKTESSQAGVVTVLVICLAGLGQSTLHVEHGQLALICLALCLKLTLMDEASRPNPA